MNMKWGALISTILTLIFGIATRQFFTLPVLKIYADLADISNYNETIWITIGLIGSFWGLIFCLIYLHILNHPKYPKL